MDKLPPDDTNKLPLPCLATQDTCSTKKVAPAKTAWVPPHIRRKREAEAAARAAGLDPDAEEVVTPKTADRLRKEAEERALQEEEEIKKRNEKHLCLTIERDVLERQHTYAEKELSKTGSGEGVEVWEENGTLVWAPSAPDLSSLVTRSNDSEALEPGMNPPMRQRKNSRVRFVRQPSVELFKVTENEMLQIQALASAYPEDDVDSPKRKNDDDEDDIFDLGQEEDQKFKKKIEGTSRKDGEASGRATEEGSSSAHGDAVTYDTASSFSMSFKSEPIAPVNYQFGKDMFAFQNSQFPEDLPGHAMPYGNAMQALSICESIF